MGRTLHRRRENLRRRFAIQSARTLASDADASMSPSPGVPSLACLSYPVANEPKNLVPQPSALRSSLP